MSRFTRQHNSQMCQASSGSLCARARVVVLNVSLSQPRQLTWIYSLQSWSKFLLVSSSTFSGRKRKRRCVYTPGHASCLSCSLRGSACVDQREAAVRAHQREDEPLRTSSRTAWNRDQVSVARGLSPVSSWRCRLGSTAPTTTQPESEDLETNLGVRPPLVPVLNNGQVCLPSSPSTIVLL